MAIYHRLVRANIAAELGRRDLTQREAAEHLRISSPSFASRMAGRTEFRLGELVYLADYLGVLFSTLTAGLDTAADEGVSA